jgi:hypothetical protein
MLLKEPLFIPGKIYNRRKDIHEVFGGNWQNGIVTSSKMPYIFIFTGNKGKVHGYQDGWDNPNVYSYTGEGQKGDMQFTRGNLALREHIKEGKRVFLFKALGHDGLIEFEAEMEFIDFGYFRTLDTDGKVRNGIKFLFKKVGASIPVINDLLLASDVGIPESFIETTEKVGLLTTRVGQGLYRKRIIHRWEYQCAVTGFNKLDTLIASHILPWADSTNEQRLDVNNGLLLSPTYDALFDRHYISFENSGKIILSDNISPKAYESIGVTGKELIHKLNSDNHYYLDIHRGNLK